MTDIAGDSGPGPRPLSHEDLEKLFQQAAHLAAGHMNGLADRPVFQQMSPDERAAILDAPLPASGLPTGDIFAFAERHILSRPFGNGHSRFMAWANSPPQPVGVAADMLASAMNPSCAGGDHAAIYLEHTATRWLLELTGMDGSGTFGLLTSGGSMATLTGLAAARHAAARRDGVDIRRDGLYATQRYTAYASDQAHSSVEKALELLGLGHRSLRKLPVDRDFRIDPAALESAVAADRAEGCRPFCVIGNAGTVNTGAIDDLDALATFCEDEDLWFHVDGAIGAASALDPRVSPQLSHMARADSVAFDPHKCLGVPVECGAILVRDGEQLRDAFSLVPPYLRTTPGVGIGGPPWFSEYGFQQTRGFRAFKLWATLAHLGRDGAGALVQHQNSLARELASLIDEHPALEPMAPVELSIACFRYRPDGVAARDLALDACNRAIVDRLQSEGRVFVTGTELHGRFAIRAATLHPGTTGSDLQVLVDEVTRVGAEQIG